MKIISNYPEYVIISPVRDEEAYIEKTINSIVFQTIKPRQWIIVNDGSKDNTGAIVEKYAREIPWIKVIYRKDRGHRKSGGGVVEAFCDGFKSISAPEWAFIIKLDGDLSFEPFYFQACFKKFEENQKLGIGGGKVFGVINGNLVWEPHPIFHVRGATKIYRRECWDAIGGLVAVPGWDTLDEVKANMLGWETMTFGDIKAIHHRFTGAADGSWRDAVKNGLADYICGYHPFWMISKCLTRLGRKPYLLGGLGHLYGYLGGYAKGVPQVDDPALIRYLRKQQLKRLFFRPSIWQ